MPQITHKKIGATWKEIGAIWIKVSGAWRKTCISWLKVGGVWEQCHVIHTITTDVNNCDMDWEALEYSNYCTVTVYPTTMDTTCTLVDTGDGTGWISAITADHTGGFTFRTRSNSDNGASSRSMNLVISDDAGYAEDKTITVTQQPEPI